MDRDSRFSGKQITAMVVAVCLAIVGAPVAVAASTGTLINITDPVTSTYKARVTAKGSLAVTPRDAVSGYNGKIDSLGRQQVAGTVSTVASGGTQAVSGTVKTVASGGTQAVSGTVTALPSGTQAVSGSVLAVPGAPGTPWAALAGTPTITVPSTRLNIEMISVSTAVLVGHQIGVTVTVMTGGVNVSVVVPVTFAYAVSGGDHYVGTLNVNLHADAGSNITVNSYDPNGTAAFDSFAVSGYLA